MAERRSPSSCNAGRAPGAGSEMHRRVRIPSEANGVVIGRAFQNKWRWDDAGPGHSLPRARRPYFLTHWSRLSSSGAAVSLSSNRNSKLPVSGSPRLFTTPSGSRQLPPVRPSRRVSRPACVRKRRTAASSLQPLCRRRRACALRFRRRGGYSRRPRTDTVTRGTLYANDVHGVHSGWREV